MTSETERLLKRGPICPKPTAPKPALTAEELGRKIAESVAFCKDLEESAYEAFKENRKDEQ